MSSPKACVTAIVPAYNEDKTIGVVLSALLEQDIIQEVIVVDDASTDSTSLIASKFEDARVRLLVQPHNAGKTAAVARGIQEARGQIIIIQDADLEYDPAEIPFVVAPIIAGRADVVFGSRFLVRRSARVLYYYHFIANRALTSLSNVFTNLNMTDMETGYKAFRADILKAIPLKSKGFGMEVELTASLAGLPLRVYEVPISYYGRTYDEGKKIGMRDGLAAIWYILYFNTLDRRSPDRRRYRERVRELLATSPPRMVTIWPRD